MNRITFEQLRDLPKGTRIGFSAGGPTPQLIGTLVDVKPCHDSGVRVKFVAEVAVPYEWEDSAARWGNGLGVESEFDFFPFEDCNAFV